MYGEPVIRCYFKALKGPSCVETGVGFRQDKRCVCKDHPHKRNKKPQCWPIELPLLVYLSLSLFFLSVSHFRSAAFQEKQCLSRARGPSWNYCKCTNNSQILVIGKSKSP